MAHNLPPVPPFDVDEDVQSLGLRWSRWLQRFDNYLLAADIKTDARKKAVLLHLAGERVYEIYLTLEDDQATSTTYDELKEKLVSKFAPKKNREYERFRFRKAAQNSTETLDQYYTRLRQLSTNCEFDHRDDELKSQLVLGCRSSALRRKALEEDKNLDELLKIGRTSEAAAIQIKEIEQVDRNDSVQVAEVNKLHKNRDKGHNHNHKDRIQKQCFKCGKEYPHEGSCPAKGRECNNCHKMNHFASMCRLKKEHRDHSSGQNVETKRWSNDKQGHKVRQLDLSEDHKDDDESDEYMFFVSGRAKGGQLPQVTVRIKENPVRLLVDSGSTVNILSLKTCQSIFGSNFELEKTNLKIMAYESTEPIKLLGKVTAMVKSKSENKSVTFQVVQSGQSLLGYQASDSLGLIRVCNSVTEMDVVQEFPTVFKGIGKFNGNPVKLHIDEKVPPVAQRHRRVPFQLRKAVDAEIDIWLQEDVIERAEGPTPWVSPIVVIEKPKQPGKVRICVDMREGNKAILRERHVMPTVDEVIHKLNGAKHFSTCDLRNGYNQLVLDKESRSITTFATHSGLYRFKRLSFGISSASEVFQNVIQTALQGLEGVINISDDILVFAETKQLHDQRLRALIMRLRELNLTLNLGKCEFGKSSVVYFGMTFSDKGMSADPKKVSAIKACQQPDSVAEVKSFLGMTSYLAKFIPNYATVSAPLRELTKMSVSCSPMIWKQAHSIAFEAIKESLSSQSALSYYDQSKDTELIVDASPVGLAAILTQKSDSGMKVLSYASRALTDVEQRYPQVHREALALTWGILYYSVYLRGCKPFSVVSDNNTVVHIFNKTTSSPPPRIERMIMKVQQFCFKVVHKSGKDNAADYLSRHPMPLVNELSKSMNDIEEHVNFIARSCIPKSMSLDEIAQATELDPVLQRVIHVLQTRSYWTVEEKNNTKLIPYLLIKNELSVTGDPVVLLKGRKLVIPFSLQARVLDLVHIGHQGMSRSKALLREKVWFPGMDKAVEKMVQSCSMCQSVCARPSSEPLKMSKLPEGAWEQVSCDFKGPLPNDDYLLVLIDDFSRFPVVNIVKSTNANTVIPVLDRIMSEMGVPRILKTDNGPPFQSEAFCNFAKELGFEHQRITPLWPASNGLVENFMKGLGKVSKISVGHGKPFVQLLHNFLRDYRSTPHPTTNYSPFRLLYGRNPRTRLPEVQVGYDNIPDDVWINDYKCKTKQKLYSDKRRRAVPSLLEEGDSVLVKQPAVGKSQLRFAHSGVVTHRKGSQVTSTMPDGKKTTRNVSFFVPAATARDREQSSCDVTDSDPHDQTTRVLPTRKRKKPDYFLQTV
jgi:hypothetical protein